MTQAGGRWELRNILDESLGLSPPCFSDLVFEFAFVTALDRNRTRSDFRRNRDREAKTGTALKISKKNCRPLNEKIWQSCHSNRSIWNEKLAKVIDLWPYILVKIYFESFEEEGFMRISVFWSEGTNPYWVFCVCLELRGGLLVVYWVPPR